MDIRAGGKHTLTGTYLRMRELVALRPAYALLAMYGTFVLVRILFAFLYTVTPVVQPDSSLYFHLSRSILRDGALLFRGQPIRYEYILYPLLLSPLHLLPQGVNVFRAAQVLNALVMNLAVFPAYALARGITGSRRKGLIVSLMTLMMPDFFMTQQLMTESVGFPLILAACWAFYKYWDANARPGVYVLWGGLAFLLYALKPGHVALPACFIVAAAVSGLRDGNRDRLLNAAFSVLAFAALYALLRLFLAYGLGMSSQQAALYETQTHPLTWGHLAQTFNGLFIYLAYVPMAFLFYPLLFPAAHHRAFAGKDRWMLWVFLAAIAATVLGTLYVIYYDEFTDGFGAYEARVHVRYVAAFLPVMLAFLFSPRLEGRRLNAPLVAALAFILAAALLLGPVPSKSGVNFNVDALLLSAGLFEAQGISGRVLWPALAAAFALALAFLLHRDGMGSRARRLIAGALVFSFIASGAVAAWHFRYHAESLFPGDASEAVSYVQGQKALGVVRDGAALWPEAVELDVASRTDIPVVELGDLLANTASDGTLGSFTPKAYWMEEPSRAIPAPTALVMSGEILNKLTLAQNVMDVSGGTAQRAYAVVPLTEGEPWVHSALTGFAEGGWVQPGSRFVLYDQELRSATALTFNFQAMGGEGTVILRLTHGTQVREVTLTNSLSWYFAAFDVETPGEPFVVELSAYGGNGNAWVETYLVE
ncbi:MAG TPA: hypothetical protein VLA21_06335 [Candidatus Limnocylindria bacterium]|nr:hypothetical protein [Candidatus Limnocylindria bacterium]